MTSVVSVQDTQATKTPLTGTSCVQLRQCDISLRFIAIFFFALFSLCTSNAFANDCDNYRSHLHLADEYFTQADVYGEELNLSMAEASYHNGQHEYDVAAVYDKHECSNLNAGITIFSTMVYFHKTTLDVIYGLGPGLAESNLKVMEEEIRSLEGDNFGKLYPEEWLKTLRYLRLQKSIVQNIHQQKNTVKCVQPHVDPDIKSQMQLEYPTLAREQGAIGTTKVAVTLDAHGLVVSATIAQSAGNAALDQEAIKEAKASTYAPEIVNCKPVAGGVYLFRAVFDYRGRDGHL